MEFNRRAPEILAAANEIRAAYQQHRGPAPAGPQPQPQLPPGYTFDPQGHVVPLAAPQAPINDPELRQFAEVLDQRMDQRLAPFHQVSQTVQRIEAVMARQEQAELQRQGQQTFNQLTGSHPIFQDPILGEDAISRLSVRIQMDGRFTPWQQLAQEVATQYDQKATQLLQRQLAAASAPPAPGAGAAVPPGGQGPVLTSEPPKNLKEASQQARSAPQRPLAGQA